MRHPRLRAQRLSLEFSGSAAGQFINNNQIGAITIQGAGTVPVSAESSPAQPQPLPKRSITTRSVGERGRRDYRHSGRQLRHVRNSNLNCRCFDQVATPFAILNGTANVAALVNESGIAYTSTSTTAASTISGNTISNLNNNSGAVATNIYGLDMTFPVNGGGKQQPDRTQLHSLLIDNFHRQYKSDLRNRNSRSRLRRHRLPRFKIT